MPNSYYNFTDTFTPGLRARSGDVDREYLAIETAFDLLPTSTTSLTRNTATFGGTAGGTANALTVTPPDSRATDANGDEIVFAAALANTAAVTLNVDGNGAQALVRPDGNALVANDLQAGLIYSARYDLANTRWQLTVPSTSYLTAAAASAAAALASENAAATSEGNAATSETNAATSETNAATSATQAMQWAVHPEDDDVDSAPGQFSAFHWAQKAQASAGNALIVGTGIVAPTAGSGYDYDAVLEFDNANSLQTAQVGWNGTDTFRIVNRAHSALTQIVGEDSLGAENVMFSADPDGETQLYRAGVKTLAADAEGISVYDGNGVSDDPAIYFRTNLESILANMEVLNGELSIRNWGASEIFRLRGTDALATNAELAQFDPDAGGRIYYAGNQTFTTTATGIDIWGATANDPTAGLAQDALLELSNNFGTRAAELGFGTDTSLILRNRVHGGLVQIHGEDSLGVNTTLFVADPDGSASLYNSGTQRIAASTTGALISGSTIDHNNSAAATDTYIRARNSVGGYRLNINSSGNLALNQISAGAAIEDTWLAGTRSGEVSLYNAGNQRFTTTATGADIWGGSANDPTLGGTQDTLLELSSSSGSRVADVGFPSLGTIMVVRNRVHGGSLELQVEDSAGNIEDVLVAAPDAGTSLGFGGATTFATKSDGVEVTGTNLILDDALDTTKRFMALNTSGGIGYQLQLTTGEGRIRQLSSLGVGEDTWINMARNAGVGLYFNDSEKLVTLTNGVSVTGTLLELDSGSAVNTFSRILNTSGGVEQVLINTTGENRIRQTSSTGTFEDNWITMSRNGGVSLYHNGVEKLATTSVGVDVLSTNLDIDNSGAATGTHLIARNSVGGIRLSVIAAGDGRIYQTNSGGTIEDTWISMARNGAVGLGYNNTTKLATRADGVDVTGSLTSTINGATTSTPGTIELATTAETSAGTATVRAITPAGFAGTKSLASDGYYVFPGGFTIQWGTETAISANSSRTFSYPRAFTTHYSGTCSYAEDTDTNRGDAAVYNNTSTTQAQVTNGDDNTAQINWVAFGLS